MAERKDSRKQSKQALNGATLRAAVAWVLDAEKVDEMFVWAFAHKPTDAQRDLALAHIGKHAMNKKVAYENILWALINTKEFVFNQ